MDNVDISVVVAGAGQAAAALAVRLRETGHRGPIHLVGNEVWPPYQRPPLSKKYLVGALERERLFLRARDFYAAHDIHLLLGHEITRIDRQARTVTITGPDGGNMRYDALVIATGGTPRLPPGMIVPPRNIFTLRGIDDADRMRDALVPGHRVLVIGGGYVGLELAAVARKRGLEVVLIEQAERILNRVACSETADYFRSLHQDHGVEILEGAAIATFEGPPDQPIAAVLTNGRRIAFEFAVFGIGIVANDSLARNAGLACDGGVVTDATGRTADPAIFAAGDCARFPVDGQMIRLESVPNAIAQGEHIADELRYRTGRPYLPSPWFWSDQYDCKLQIAGLNSGYTAVLRRDGAKPGVRAHWYFRDDTLIACDTMNDPRSFMLAKRWLATTKRPTAKMLADPSFNPAAF